MMFVIFIVAWLVLLASAVTEGNIEEGSPLRWFCVGVIILCAVHTMFTVNFMAGVGMIGSLAFFSVKKSDSDARRKQVSITATQEWEKRTLEKTSHQASEQQLEAQRCLERAYACEEKNEFEKALHECELAIRLAPDFAEAHNLRGIVLEELGRAEDAVAAYRKAVRLDPALSEARENLLEAEAELEGGRTEKKVEGLP